MEKLYKTYHLPGSSSGEKNKVNGFLKPALCARGVQIYCNTTWCRNPSQEFPWKWPMFGPQRSKCKWRYKELLCLPTKDCCHGNHSPNHKRLENLTQYMRDKKLGRWLADLQGCDAPEKKNSTERLVRVPTCCVDSGWCSGCSPARRTQRECQTYWVEEMETEVQGGWGGWDSWEGALEEKSLTERSMDCSRWVSDWVLLWGFWGGLRRWGDQQSWEPMQTVKSSPSHQPERKDFIIHGAWIEASEVSHLSVCVCVCVCVHTRSVAKSSLTVCDTIDCSPPGSSIHGISQTRRLEWVAISSSRGSSWARDWTCVFCLGR